MVRPVRLRNEGNKWFDASTARYFYPAAATAADEVLLLTARGQFVLSQPGPTPQSPAEREYSRVTPRHAVEWLTAHGFSLDFMQHVEAFDPADES